VAHFTTVTLSQTASGYLMINSKRFESGYVILRLPAYEDGKDSVPKRRHIKFRRRGITQKKTYNIQNTAKV